MIKEVLQQLEPLDAQIDALCSRADDAEMASTTTHAAELAELSAEENTLLQRCTSLTPEDRVFLARRPDRPHITEMIDNLFTDFFEQCVKQCFIIKIFLIDFFVVFNAQFLCSFPCLDDFFIRKAVVIFHNHHLKLYFSKKLL